MFNFSICTWKAFSVPAEKFINWPRYPHECDQIRFIYQHRIPCPQNFTGQKCLTTDIDIYARTHTLMGWKVYMMMSYLSAIEFFWPIKSKHCNTNERSVWTTRGTMLMNKPYLVTFHGSILVSLSLIHFIYISSFNIWRGRVISIENSVVSFLLCFIL